MQIQIEKDSQSAEKFIHTCSTTSPSAIHERKEEMEETKCQEIF